MSETEPTSERIPPPYDDLDPGIREVVRWLWDAGFETRDSGDGHSKGAGPGALEADWYMHEPHVFVVCSPDAMVGECDRLAELFESIGVELQQIGAERGPQVQGTYDPAVPLVGIVMVTGFDDSALAAALRADEVTDDG